jgi:hypothetical protein
VAADRIGAAFASLDEMARPGPAITAAAVRASKGDFGAPPTCKSGVWPNIDASCLVRADGAPAHNVRTITIGYRSGENTTVLVRLPAADLASR